MSRLTPITLGLYIGILITLASSQVHAFEQGTYFIYQVVEQSDSPTTGKRLALSQSLFVENEASELSSELKPSKRSEFEIDYTSLGRENHSTFSSPLPISQKPTATTDKKSLFDLGTTETPSRFGN
jgi:hypothetical protein